MDLLFGLNIAISQGSVSAIVVGALFLILWPVVAAAPVIIIARGPAILVAGLLVVLGSVAAAVFATAAVFVAAAVLGSVLLASLGIIATAVAVSSVKGLTLAAPSGR